MATQSQINAHDALIDKLSTRFGKGLRPLFTSLVTELAFLGANPSRTQVLALFAPISAYVANQRELLNEIYASNILMNADVIDSSITSLDTESIMQETLFNVQKTLETQQNTVINSVVLGGLTGAAIGVILKDLRAIVSKSIKTITNTFNTIVRNFDGAVTILRGSIAGIDKYRYVGGLIKTSRRFCSSHNGQIMTVKEINRIWRGSWGGKAPGSPFVVRGGYNCRHIFVPIKETV
tara:strand:- start:13572 stop:14279 length:708 start_codon:yes stop_codon:yes gene_type:complete